MAHSNGRIYIDTSTTPNKGVEIADLQQVFERGTGDLGQLCSDQEAYIDHYENEGASDFDPDDESTWGAPVWALRQLVPPRINRWARKKNVPLSGSTPELGHPDDNWFMGKDKNFGIYSKTFFSVSDIASILANIDGDMNGWEYRKDSLAYRLRDFEGYYHYAKNPFNGLELHVTPQVVPGENVVVEYLFRGSEPSQDEEIGIEEIACEGLNDATHDGVVSVAEMYLAILVYKANGGSSYTFKGWATSSTNLSGLTDGAARNVQFPIGSSETGNYIVVPMLCEVAKQNADPSQVDNAWTLIPGTNIMNFEVTTVMLPWMQVDAYVFSQNYQYGTTIYYRASFFAGTQSASNTFRDVTMRFVTRNGVTLQTIQNVQDPTGADLVVNNGQTVYVPASSSDYATAQWSAGMDIRTFIEQEGGKIVLSGSGADSYETVLGARPVRD